MKRYLLFDLDGTLTDPKVGITTCVQYALASFGIEEPDLDKLEPFIGPPLKDSFMEFYHMNEADAQAAVDKYRERFRDTGIFENEIYAGVPQMLKTLKAKGLQLAVASSKPTVFVERILDHFHIAKYFKVVVGSELDGTRVEKDQVVEEALRQLFGDEPVEKDQVYMIGDRRFDVEGARAQGIESVGVTYGYGSMEELKAARADYIVRSVEELQRFLLRGTDELQRTTSLQKVWQMLFPLLLFFLVRNLAAFLMLLLLFYAGGSISGNVQTVVSTLSYVAAILSVIGTVKVSLNSTAEDMYLSHLKQESGKSYVILGVLTVCAVFGLNMLLELSGIIGTSESYQALQANQFSAYFALGLVCYGLITPIVEELMFRGVVYGQLRSMMNVRIAMVLSALLFGLYHMNAVQGIYGFVMGCLMVYAYEYFGTFKAAVFIHITANVLAYCMRYSGLAASGFVSWPACIVFLTVAVAGLFLLYRKRQVL